MSQINYLTNAYAFNLRQVNGKLRATVEVDKAIDQEGALAAALAQDSVQRQLGGKEVKKVVFVPGKILNLIVPK